MGEGRGSSSGSEVPSRSMLSKGGEVRRYAFLEAGTGGGFEVLRFSIFLKSGGGEGSEVLSSELPHIFLGWGGGGSGSGGARYVHRDC